LGEGGIKQQIASNVQVAKKTTKGDVFIDGMFKKGRISGQEYECATNTTDASCSTSIMDKSSQRDTNAHRNVVRRMTKQTTYPTPYVALIPMWDNDRASQIIEKTHFTLIYEALDHQVSIYYNVFRNAKSDSF
jgi:hypothetical protein